MKHILPVIVAMVYFLAIGIICTFWPEKVRDYEISHPSIWSSLRYAKNPKAYFHVLMIRMVGIGSLIGFLGTLKILFNEVKNGIQ